MTPFGIEIRKIRSSRGVMLKEHAALAGVTAAYLSMLEHGRRGVPCDEMQRRIVEALGVTPAEERRLLSLAKFSNPKVIFDTSGLSPLATELVNRLAHELTELTEADLEELLWQLHVCTVERPDRR